MSTPTLNTVPTTDFVPVAGNDGALQDGVKWGLFYGTGVTLTYSFPSGEFAWFIDPYSEFEAWYPLTSSEKSAVRSALAEWGAIANLTFVEVGDGKNLVGDLRFGLTDIAGDEAAHAYLPWDGPEGGDVWFKNGEWHTKAGSPVNKGSFDYLTVLHEIGHAVGLKHSFEGPNKIAKAYDHFAYTVMSYSASVWSSDNNASFYPTTPMYYDLVNIQGMYGRGVHNSDNTVYAFKDGKNYWQTIDDTGGIDTIVRKGSDKGIIDLNVQQWSDLGRSIQFDGGSTKLTVAIGPNTLIENATGGAGKDKIIGNAAANVLAGGGGKDNLTGDAGPDAFLFDAKPGADNRDVVKDFTAGEDVVRLAQKAFSALASGVLTADAFDTHFDYAGGILEYHGKALAKLNGAPAIDAGDFFVV